MAKNPKTEQTNGASSADAAGAETPSAAATSAPKKRAKATKTTAAKTPASKGASKKSGAKKTAAPQRAKKSSGYEPSDDEIRIRAYFVAERRLRLALDGDAANDWIVARRQLVEEASQRSA